MAILNNSLTKKETFSTFLTSTNTAARIKEVIGKDKYQDFLTSILAAVNANPLLVTCTYMSILNAAFLGASLNFSPAPTLGHFYIVPYNKKTGDNWESHAQFQIGYKGLIQLALRSGEVIRIDAFELREGELEKYNPLTGTVIATMIDDGRNREMIPVAGYYAMIKLKSGFIKKLYWSKAKMEAHASRYSKPYQKDKKKGEQNSLWSTHFDLMGLKTLLRQLLGTWCILTPDLQKALQSDADDVGNEEPINMGDAEEVEVAEIPVEEVNKPVDDFFTVPVEEPLTETATAESVEQKAADNLRIELINKFEALDRERKKKIWKSVPPKAQGRKEDKTGTILTANLEPAEILGLLDWIEGCKNEG